MYSLTNAKLRQGIARVLPQAGDQSGSKIYTPLPTDQKAFRLLTLKPGKRNDLIRCTLHHSRLDVDPLPVYETISYCWGDASVRDVIKVGKRLVSVPASSAAALRRVRLQDSSRIVWIDAVCINQEDFFECSSQVLLMRDVFSKGIRGLVYLGEDDVVDAFRAVRMISEDPGTVEVFSKLADISSSDEFKTSPLWRTGRQAFTGDYSDNVVQELLKLYSLDWFCRVWTYQEAILAQNSVCFCGTSAITLLEITRCAVMLAVDNAFLAYDVVRSSTQIVSVIWLIEPSFQADIQSEDLNAGGTLAALASRKCSVPVDRIYGMLGVYPELEITPDYSKPTVQVFMEATKILMAHDAALDLLSLASESSDRAVMPTDDTEGRIPSWVPQLWKPVEELDLQWATVGNCIACKGRIFDPSRQVGECPSNKLRTSGFVVDRIGRLAVGGSTAATSDIGDFHHAPAPFLRFLEQFATDTVESRQLPTNQGHFHGFTQAEVELATAIFDGVNIRSSSSRELGLRKWKAFRYFVYAGCVDGLSDLPAPVSNSGADADYNELVSGAHFYRSRFILFLTRWRLASTDSHLLGIVTKAAEVGDIVVILNGLDCPAVLRPVGDQYVFIGPAWIYGIMDGEAVERHENAGGVDEIFELC